MLSKNKKIDKANQVRAYINFVFNVKKLEADNRKRKK